MSKLNTIQDYYKTKEARKIRDYNKCERIIDSCKTFDHSVTAMNVVRNFGRMYGHDDKQFFLVMKSYSKYLKCMNVY